MTSRFPLAHARRAGRATTGGVTLPRHIDWGPHYIYDLADEADFRLMYERVIREAQTRDDLNAYLHATSLRQVWHDLFLPLPVRTAWKTTTQSSVSPARRQPLPSGRAAPHIGLDALAIRSRPGAAP
ncbi:hypothetical protein [Streptomyces milbemycinicus]|uniref:hypothetical protein n=1 Tax=Streptomyces milbemycinicus TaxID=476552 RepID=UPI0033F15319